MDKKKLAAAMAAVFAYIKTEEEAAAQFAQAAPQASEAPVIQQVINQIVGQSNVWGISGRQTQMQANSMMQMRMFK